MRSALEWAQVRTLAADEHSQREIAARLGSHRRTVRPMLTADEPPRYKRARVGSRIDAFDPVIRRVLDDWPQIKARSPAVRRAPRRSSFIPNAFGFDKQLVQPMTCPKLLNLLEDVSLPFTAAAPASAPSGRQHEAALYLS